MKPPLILERALRGLRLNREWFSTVAFFLAGIAVFGLFVFTVVDSIRSENTHKDKLCGVHYQGMKWEYENYDPNPDDQSVPKVDKCYNPETKERKDFPKE